MENKLRQLQLAELKILKDSLSFFEQNDIPYYALGGTLLGAVRHHGFIPWDDDIDIGVPREAYNRMLSLMQQGKSSLEFRTVFNCKEHLTYITRIVNSKILVQDNRSQVGGITEAWVDIFPLDGMPNSKLLQLLHKFHILYRRMLFVSSEFSKAVTVSRKNRSLFEKILVQIVRNLRVENLLDMKKEFIKLDRVLKMYPYSESEYLVNAMGAYKFKEMFHKKYYGEGRMYQFEDIQIRGPVDYDFVLTQLYGDYMTPPAEDDPERNHHSIVDITFDEDETK